MSIDPVLSDPRLPSRTALAAIATIFGGIAAAAAGVTMYFIAGAAAGRGSHLLLLFLTLPGTAFLTVYFGFIAYGIVYHLLTGRRPPGRHTFERIADTLANTYVFPRRRRRT